MDEIYDRYVKPLEDQHIGQYAAVSPKGDLLLAPSFIEAIQQSTQRFGKGNFVFKVGERVVGEIL
jgi:hypothetical protein